MFSNISIFEGNGTTKTLLSIIELFGYEDILNLSSWNGVDLDPKAHIAITTNKLSIYLS